MKQAVLSNYEHSETDAKGKKPEMNQKLLHD